MLAFSFEYQTHKILYLVDALGREKVDHDGEITKLPTKQMFKSTAQITIHVKGEPLTLTRKVLSYTDGEYEVTLENAQGVIEVQNREVAFRDMSNMSEQAFYKDDERYWVKEINPPRKVFKIGMGIYLMGIASQIASKLFDLDAANTLAITAASAVLAYVAFDCIKLVKNTLAIKIETPKY
jgi:hypothetical protein